MSYDIHNFLIDQKCELHNLSVMRKKAKGQSEREEIKRQQTYLYNQGLDAMRRYSRETPSCVKSYYLGNKSKPTSQEISKELSEINVNYGKINHRIAYIFVASVMALLFLLMLL